MNQNYIGKLLPIEGYYVLFDGVIPTTYSQSLTHLYQPLIGIQAISLYQTLLSEYLMRHDQNTPQNHHTLMNYISLPLDEIYQARLKLEGIGLLRTYTQEHDQNKVYMYQLIPPFSPDEFFDDGMLSQLLFHHLGKKKYNELLMTITSKQTSLIGHEITANFNDVFDTSTNIDMTNSVPKNNRKQSDKGVNISESTIDFSLLEQVLTQRMLQPSQILTSKNKKLISQMAVLYNLTNQEIEKALMWAINDENYLEGAEFTNACMDLSQTKQNQTNLKLANRKDKVAVKQSDQPLGKEEKFIQMLEQISPKQLLEDLSGGNQASTQDLKVISDVMTKQGLTPGVMNVLIHYVLLKTDMKLTKSYLEKIASHWARKNVKTVRQAMALAKSEHKKYQQWGNNKQQNYKKSSKKEVIPDWFYDRNKTDKPNKTDNKENKKQEQQDDVADLLKQYINEKKSNDS